MKKYQNIIKRGDKELRNKKLGRYLSIYIPMIIIVVVIVGSIISHSLVMQEIEFLKDENKKLQKQLEYSIPSQNSTLIIEGNISISKLYEEVRDSIVEIHGIVQSFTFFGPQISSVQGSGFVYNFSGDNIIITNYHVVQDAIEITVTFSNGNEYPAELLGSDPYIDAAVLSVDAPNYEFKPLQIISSSFLQIGDPVIAIGNPFGLEGTITSGIISQLGRTIEESTTGSFPIANIIQTSAAINPGNSGNVESII